MYSTRIYVVGKGKPGALPCTMTSHAWLDIGDKHHDPAELIRTSGPATFGKRGKWAH
jgi:hypothetical protein